MSENLILPEGLAQTVPKGEIFEQKGIFTVMKEKKWCFFLYSCELNLFFDHFTRVYNAF